MFRHMPKSLTADYADENGFVSLFADLHRFFLAACFSDLRKSAKSVDDSVFLAFHANAEAWLVALKWRQQMREQVIADLLPLNHQLL